MVAEVAVPDVQEFRQVVDVGEIDLRLDRVLERAAAGLERGLEPRVDEKLGLQPDIGAVPERIGRAIGGLGDPGHLVVVRHLAGDKDVVARDQRSDEAGVLRHGHALGLRRLRRAVPAGQHRNHRHVHVGAGDQQLVHQHGRARRHELLEHRLAGALIGVHHLRVGVVLIDPHDVSEVAALGGNQLGKAIDDEVALAAIARRAAERQAGLAGDHRGETVLEIGCHVAGEEQPRTGAHALRVFDVRASDARRSDTLHVGH